MKKNEIRWWMVLAVIAVVYHIIIFALPFAKTPVFFVSWLFTAAAIAVQVPVIRRAFFQEEGIQSKFYGFPIAKLSLIYLAAQFVFSFFFMALGRFLPLWLPLICYFALLGAAAVGLIAADGIREEVERQETQIEKRVDRIRKFQSLSQTLANQNSMPEAEEELKKLEEAFRYSDPVSSGELEGLEDRLAEDLARLQDAVTMKKLEDALNLCRKTKADLEERNRLCRLQKR